MANETNFDFSKKIKNFYFILLLFCILLFVFCIKWQVVEAARFAEISRSRTNSSTIKSQRGSIYSADGSVLAYSEPRFDMFLWLDDILFFEEKGIQTRDEFLDKISPIIEMSRNDLQTMIENNLKEKIRWIPVAKSLSTDQWQKLIDLKTNKFSTEDLRGFLFERNSKRIYPEGRLAAHVIGLTNSNNNKINGLGGIEESYNGVLNPITGFLIDEKDAIGQTITASLLPTIEPKNGSSVYTTINKRLQQVVEEKLKIGVDLYQATSGTVVIMDPKTGAIMALANYPDYDPNFREEKEPGVYGDSATLRPYEAGSIGKILTVATGIELGMFTPDAIIQPEGHQGCEKIHNDLLPLCTWDEKPKPPMKVWECFAESDNICFYHMGLMLPRNDFYSYLNGFGIGKASGIDLGRGDSFGLLKDYTSWNIGDVAAFSYGHGYQVNPIQAAEYVSVIANKGVRMRPKIVDKIIDSDNVSKEFKPTVVERVIKEETAATVAAMMNINFQRSIPANEYYYQDLLNYNIGVKSGTALIADRTGYTLDINSTFVGFDASDERTFVMLLKLERPQIPAYDRLAFYNARPLWLELFKGTKDIIGVPRK